MCIYTYISMQIESANRCHGVPSCLHNPAAERSFNVKAIILFTLGKHEQTRNQRPALEQQ